MSNIEIEEDITIRTESSYLIISHRQNCKKMMKYPSLRQEDIIDILISLHIVLEVGINSFFRQIIISSIKKKLGDLEVIRNIDRIGFIDKTILFIYNSKFDFNGKEEKANEYHKIIGMLIDFSGIRNSLLHGHAITTIQGSGEVRHSKLKEKINKKYLLDHINKFKNILEGISFYFDCLVSGYTPSGKDSLKKEYLDTSFLSSF